MGRIKKYDTPEKKRLYQIYKNMKYRCNNVCASGYEYYGGKGIRVCEQWENDPLSFINWAENNGYKIGLSIDRIDPNKNYTPENCQWTTIRKNNGKTTRREKRGYGFKKHINTNTGEIEKVMTFRIPYDIWFSFKQTQIERQMAGEKTVTLKQAALNGLRAELEESK